MAKRKSKKSALQTDKLIIQFAKKMKQQGLLSKQAKLHSGKYVSKAVAKKVLERQHLSRLDYRAVKAPKATVEAARLQGFETIGNKIVGPNTNTFRARIKRGLVAGVSPVKGGYMEQVQMPTTIFDMRQLFQTLDTGNGIDSLKEPDEYFAFKINGRESYRPLKDSAELRAYLEHYQNVHLDTEIDMTTVSNDDEPPLSLVIFRLHRNDIRHLFPEKAERKQRNRERRRANATGRSSGRVYKNKYDNMPENRARLERAKEAEKKRKYREELRADPAKREAYKQAARARAKESYNRRFK